jgi:hypothetical protein
MFLFTPRWNPEITRRLITVYIKLCYWASLIYSVLLTAATANAATATTTPPPPPPPTTTTTTTILRFTSLSILWHPSLNTYASRTPFFLF